MDGENGSDFDSAIDNFIDHFFKDPEKNDPIPTGALQALPKVMKNDIRRYYSRMFMNTINSGDFNQLQSYFSTFMRGTSKFVANYGDFNPGLRLPNSLTAEGPKLMAHCLLGAFVMYPDLVMHMSNTCITTSNTWLGTKIEMTVDYTGTKMFHLDVDEWVPQRRTLERRCTSLVQVTNRETGKEPALSGANSSAGEVCGDIQTSSTDSASGSESVLFRRGTNCEAPSDDSFPDAGGSRDDLSERHASNDSQDDDLFFAGKRKRSALSATCDTLPLVSAVGTPDSVGENYINSNDIPIPEEYVHALCSQATVLTSPIKLHMTGVITMFLDENNHIQHMSMRMSPK